MVNKNDILRKIPQVDELMNDEKIVAVAFDLPHDFLVNCIREVIDDVRSSILNNAMDKVDKSDIIDKILVKTSKKSKPTLRKIINATGVVLHTNLGRAIISKKAADAIVDVASNYTNLEYDLKKGTRGDRQKHIEKVITDLTGAEAAMVVNNNAAATILVLAALAKGKEVIISRGELIEIGGSFRIPDVMSESGAILKEIGTTNKTKISDYKNAITEETGALLKVHTSNYKVVGFTESCDLDTLVPLGNEYNLPVIYDMGNGLFVDLNKYGIDEPTVPSIIKNNADVLLFSGDKLLGGPQAGIIIGREKYISLMKKHPLARAFRVDKFTIAALTTTLFEYYDDKKAKVNVPVLKMITIEKSELENKAKTLKSLLEKIDGIDVEIVEVKDQIGGGTAPDVYIDGYAVAIKTNIEAQKFERAFRDLDVPMIVRIYKDMILFDVRTIDETDFDTVFENVKVAYESFSD